MMHKEYEFVSDLSIQATLIRIEGLFSQEGVKYDVYSNRVASVRTPIAVSGVQATLYSHGNWIGINPFVFVSSVAIQFEAHEGGLTRITVRVNRRRALLWVLFWLACGLLTATGMSRVGGALFVLAIGAGAWLSIVSFFGGHLLICEIEDHLKVQ